MRDRVYYWRWFKRQMEEYMRSFYLSACPIPKGTDMISQYEKCSHCGNMSVFKGRCMIGTCSWTDPDYHSPTCMCIECIPTPKEPEDAADSQTTNPHDPDLGGEAG